MKCSYCSREALAEGRTCGDSHCQYADTLTNRAKGFRRPSKRSAQAWKDALEAAALADKLSRPPQDAKFKVEVRADDSGEWVGNQLRFATKEEAESYGQDLSWRWTAVRQYRVVEEA